MSVPNHAHVPQKLFDTGLFDLKTHEGQGAFTDAVVATLNGIDENWRHLKKKPGQTAVHNHGEDSALYLFPDGTALAVDFIGGAGGPTPRPSWGVGDHVYKHSDAHDPDEHGIGGGGSQPAPQVPSYAEIGDDAFYRAMVGVPLFADYLTAHTAGHPDAKPNDGMSAWFSRSIYRVMSAFMKANGQPIDPVGEVRIVRNEWRQKLGLPPV